MVTVGEVHLTSSFSRSPELELALVQWGLPLPCSCNVPPCHLQIAWGWRSGDPLEQHPREEMGGGRSVWQAEMLVQMERLGEHCVEFHLMN